jgi:hypothetical protein
MNSRGVALARVTVVAAYAVVFVSLHTTGHGQTRGTPVPPTLAKARVTEARAAAKAWRADAVLIQVASSQVGDGGVSTLWDYGFWSSSAKTCAVINVAPGRTPFTQESGGAICEAPELKDFAIDSDQAYKIARANGITAARVSMVVSMAPVKGVNRASWSVMDEGGVKPGNVMLDIDATTGVVLGKMKQ